jgi:phage-related tail protein
MTKIDVSKLSEQELEQLWKDIIEANALKRGEKFNKFLKNKKVVTELKKTLKTFKKEQDSFDKIRYGVADFVGNLAKEHDLAEYDLYVLGGIEEGYI